MEDLLLVPIYGLLVGAAVFKKATHVLLANIASNVLSAAYLLMLGTPVGAVLGLIAAGSSLVQLVIGSETAAHWRYGVASAAAAIATVLLYQVPADALVCGAILLMRLAEASGRLWVMRLGFIVGGACWAIYAGLLGLWWMSAAEASVALAWAVALFLSLKTSRNALQRPPQAAQA